MSEWIEDDAVARAMAAVPRARFLPRSVRSRAAVDAPLRIGRGQTNSQPTTVAIMLRLLDVQPGQRVLDVGAGSGWTTALLAHLVGPQGWVIGVERHSSLVESARAALADHSGGNAEIRPATSGSLGAPKDAPFDRILVSAGARTLPDALVEQLAEDAVMVIPVEGRMLRVTRHAGHTTTTEHGRFSFVPLIED